MKARASRRFPTPGMAPSSSPQRCSPPRTRPLSRRRSRQPSRRRRLRFRVTPPDPSSRKSSPASRRRRRAGSCSRGRTSRSRPRPSGRRSGRSRGPRQSARHGERHRVRLRQTGVRGHAGLRPGSVPRHEYPSRSTGPHPDRRRQGGNQHQDQHTDRVRHGGLAEVGIGRDRLPDHLADRRHDLRRPRALPLRGHGPFEIDVTKIEGPFVGNVGRARRSSFQLDRPAPCAVVVSERTIPCKDGEPGRR